MRLIPRQPFGFKQLNGVISTKIKNSELVSYRLSKKNLLLSMEQPADPFPWRSDPLVLDNWCGTSVPGQRDGISLTQLSLKFITWTPLASSSSPACHPGPASPLSLVRPYQRQQLEVHLGHHYRLSPEHHGADDLFQLPPSLI